MQTADYLVLAGYFLVMILIGVLASLKIKAQEDYFMGGRSFGKLLQTFAAFGAGTGSSDPVNIGRTTFTSGMSGMWSVMSWLFVTPFYWIAGVWYRRMRHLTLGDWFVERYESRALGLGYCVFGLLFFMVYGSMLFSAIGKVAAPLVEVDTFAWGDQRYGIEYLLVPVIGVVVLLYGILGGLRAAYFTDLIQGVCIILLSVILVPYGLSALVQEFGDPQTQSLWSGFRIMHEQLPRDYFSIVGATTASEFPLHRIAAVVIISLVGIVVQPHFIATGGGSAKTETNARVGLVLGNFLKRFCTIGWVLTALIALALFADRPELVEDPDKTWGVASRELLGPGLTGLMLACLLAALMSSVDAYMIVGAALVVRNFYAAYLNPRASEREYVLMGRLTGVLVVGGAVVISLFMMDVFAQLELTWVFPVLFAAPFWIGMFWRRATTAAAWTTVAYCALTFFLVPFLAPILAPALRTAPALLTTNQLVRTTTSRTAAPSDVARRQAEIQRWTDKEAQLQQLADPAARQAALEGLGARPAELAVGETFQVVEQSGGTSIFWGQGVKPVDASGRPRADVRPEVVREETEGQVTRQFLQYPADLPRKGFGNLKLDFLLYQALGMDLTTRSNATLSTLELPPKIISPFLLMILVSLFTRPNSQQALDRYYAKMKTPVVPDHEQDQRNLQQAYADPEGMERRKLFPGTSLEFQRPTTTDVLGFLICFAACFGIIGLAMLVAQLGAGSS
ncbi:MAG: hypothetical protein J5I93_11125 [Pirellulaceae bacterium]|nr:hypothetical protein [Pirellulaceae bacterium]